MDKNLLSGSAQITAEGIKKHFQNTEPTQALIELVWNGFDANANNVQIIINHNDLGGLDLINIIDDGDGIEVRNLENSFGKF